VRALNRHWQVIVSLVLATAAVGFITAVRNPPRLARSLPPPSSSAARALSYTDLRAGYRGPNAGLYANAYSDMQRQALLDPVGPQTDADTAQALASRASRRAYDGAPPTIPHAVAEQAAPACLSCHQAGAHFAGRAAPAMSHEPFQSCVQCHAPTRAESTSTQGPPPFVSPGSDFEGRSPERGARAWVGAPPTIPHAEQMRSRCESCHGVFGKLGMRSTHPWRQNCRQCHAPSAELDRRAPSAVAPSP
jgi:cytochrome c-type protein NapB